MFRNYLFTALTKHHHRSYISSEVEINGKWKTRWKRFFPTGFMKEARPIFTLTWPIYVIMLLGFVVGPISMIFSGHLGTAELASVAMATSPSRLLASVVNLGTSKNYIRLRVIINPFIPKLLLEGKNKKALGVHLQRGILILSLSCMPCWVIHLNAQQLLMLIGQEPDVARLTGDYMLIYIPGFLFSVLQQVLGRYLQVQGMLKPLILVGLLSNGLNILLQYFLVYIAQMGIYGSSLSQTISYLVMLVLTLLYIIIWRKYETTWPGWTWKCLENWGVFMKLAISGLVMTALELWIFEIGVFLSGLLGEVELAATSTCLQIQIALYLLSFSFATAVSIRVGCNLGAGSADGAKTASCVTLVLSFLCFIVETILLLSLMSVTPYIFTSDVVVANLATSMMPIIVITIYTCAISVVIEGILRGVGRQFIGALMNTSTYILLILPMVGVFMFVVKIGPAGFWWGVAIGQIPASFIYLIILARMNWKGEVDKVGVRILASDMTISVEAHDVDDVINQSSVLLDGNTPLHIDNTHGSTPSSSQQKPGDMRNDDEEIDADDLTSIPETFSYLICKRVAVFLVLLAILVAGILSRVFIPLPEASISNSTLTNSTDQMTTMDTVTEL